ncbi:MAG: twin transmembrane helix small protein [Alphaproteobacteria bacterium]
MTAALPYVIFALAAAVVVVLFTGLINMVRRQHDPRTSNKLMRWRVGLQLGAVLLLVVLMLLLRN